MPGPGHSTTTVRRLRPGDTAVEVRTTPAGVNAPPVELGDVSDAMATAKLPGPGGEIRLEQPRTTRYVLVWFTSLPQIAEGKFRAQVREITVTR